MRNPRPVFLALLATLATPGSAWAYEDGATGFSGQSATTCAMCHTSGAFTPVSSLDGPVQVPPSSIDNAYTFEVAAVLASVGGFDVSADGGVLGTTDSGAQISSGEVTQTAPRAFVSDLATFSFEWTAPSTEGTYTLFGCGVAGDGDGLFTGDDTDCTTLTVVVCDDADADGICDSVDNCPTDANPDQADSDGDGIGDVCEAACTDSDGDGVCDDVDVCPDVADSTQTDTDGDGIGDACDTCVEDPLDDADGDGVCGDVDNCPAAANGDQLDTDGDGLGDACDACPADLDNDADADGVCGDLDNCPADANDDQLDADGDELGDACDACPADLDNDADADGVCGDVDNCPTDANNDQLDADGDDLGDACDACPADLDNDADADGVCGDVDNCPADANDDQADTDGDGLGDACDTPVDTGDTDTGSDTGDTDTGDTDDTGDTTEGCNCSASPTGGALALLPALLGLAVLRRRRAGA